MLRLTALTVLTATMLAGCSDFPELDAAVSPTAQEADYPSLLPMNQVIKGVADVQITPETVETLQGRTGSLRARAARLRGPVIDGATRARMRAAMARHR